MKYQIDRLKKTSERPRAICLGFFDGLHLGHRKVFDECLAVAKQKKYRICVLTFLESPKADLKVLTPYQIKIKLLEEWGCEEVIALDFNQETKNTSPEDFINFLIEELKAEALFYGKDFRFGKDGSGDINLLANSFKNSISLHLVDDYYIDGILVSSTLIKTALQIGDVIKTSKYLGREYKISGIVKEGLHNGGKIGFKTANIELPDNLFIPKKGVYEARIKLDERLYRGIANVGYHPSIEKLIKPILEVHIFDFDQSIYGETIDCSLLNFIREEEKFTNLNDLKMQIASDIIFINKKYEKK